MIDKASVLKVALIALALAMFLFTENLATLQPVLSPTSIVCATLSILREPRTQWIVFLCLGLQFSTFCALESSYGTRMFWRIDNPTFWLTSTLMGGGVVYAMQYSDASQSSQALIFVTGAMISRCAAWGLQGRVGKHLPSFVIVTLVALLLVALVWPVRTDHGFTYRGLTRRTGPWENPNIYGLLMGVGMTLAVGAVVCRIQRQVPSETKSENWKLRPWVVYVTASSLAAVLFSRGLLSSYSRGAWLGTFLGLMYLIVRRVNEFRIQNSQFARWICRNAIPSALTIVSILVLIFWHFRQTEWRPVRRMFSLANENDLSWRNRLAASQGALQIMAQHPWLGVGWNVPETLYEQCHLPIRVVDGLAIQMNDYLIFGASLGIPALVCFCVYILGCLGITGWKHGTNNNSSVEEDSQSHWIQIVCRAGAIVLAGGFWFDGGLFELPTASVFWILLELGRAS